MAWFLVGLTVFAMFMGSLTAFLTVKVVKMNSNRGAYYMAKDGQPLKVFFSVLINKFIILFAFLKYTLIHHERKRKLILYSYT